MKRICLALACAAALHAATIRGVVVENQTSKPLSHAEVTLLPIEGGGGASKSIRADRFGAFTFLSLPAGAYLVRASRRGFMPMESGQKRWNSAGAPVIVGPDENQVVTIRLPRYSGITGTIVDENEVGLPGGEVLAYRYSQPPVLVGRGRSDERGVYRIGGLAPGYYLVRSAGFEDDGVSYLPTFSREAIHADESRPVEAYFEQDTGEVDLRPREGALITISGSVGGAWSSQPVTVTLASEMGRLTSQGTSFRFGPLPPGVYEIYAETAREPVRRGFSRGDAYQAAYRGFVTTSNVDLDLQPVRETRIEISPGPSGGAQSVRLYARRRDLAGVGPVQELQLTDTGAMLPPGRWELRLAPPPGYYVAGVTGFQDSQNGARPDGWNELMVRAYASVGFTLSNSPATVNGVVKSAGAPVAGAPVYLEAYDSASRGRVAELRTTRADSHGAYRFESITPGEYRILSTFEYNAPGALEMEAAGAQTLRLQARESVTEDLGLYVIR